MGVPEGYTVVSCVVPTETHDRLRALAQAHGMSVSYMLAEWLESGASAPLERTGKRQKVRPLKPDELFISLPREWLRLTGCQAHADVVVSYSAGALIVRPAPFAA